MILMKNADIYAPKHMGKKDLLISYNKIAEIGEKLNPNIKNLEIIDLKGKKLVPGFIDQHVHIIGGGGEGGFESATPELKLSSAVEAGVTTLVGVLGTDGISKNTENLLAKTKALNHQGITAYCLSSSYHYPEQPLTNSIMKDIAYINEIIGCKLAFSDHRSSHPTKQEIIRLVSDIRVASLIAGKAGVLHMHIGPYKDGIKPIMEIVEETDIPIFHFRPTHMGRHMQDSMDFANMGGYVDLTSGEDTAEKLMWLRDKAPVKNITLSSDSNGSAPIWDENRNMIGIGIGKMTSLFDTIREMVIKYNLPLENALEYITSNVADALNFSDKGRIYEGKDADFAVLDDELRITDVFAGGKLMMKNNIVIKKGMFE